MRWSLPSRGTGGSGTSAHLPRPLQIQHGFQQDPYNSGVAKASLTSNRGFQQGPYHSAGI
jgi:hypothetical protein